MQSLVSVLASLTTWVGARKMYFPFQILLIYLAKGQRISQIHQFVNVGETIQKNSQKSESYMMSLKDIMDEVRSFSKDLKMVKESQAKLLRTIGENHDIYEKKIEILSGKISENIKCLKQVKLQAEKSDEMYDVQQNFCTKVLRDVENERKHSEKNMKNMVTEICCEINNSIRDLSNNFEETLDQNFCALRKTVSLSNEEKIRNDEYLRRKNLLFRQNVANVNNLSGFMSTSYASSKSKPKFEDDYRYNKYGSNSEKYLMNSSNHLGEQAREVSYSGITHKGSPMSHKMFENVLQKPSSCDFGTDLVLKKNLNDKNVKFANRRQNASGLNVSNVSLPKSRAKNVGKKSLIAASSVPNGDEVEHKYKLRSSGKKTLSTKIAAKLPTKKRKNGQKNKNVKKNQDTTSKNKNQRSISTKIVNAPVVRKLKSHNKIVRSTGNTSITNCTLFSTSYDSSPSINIFEAINLEKEFQYFA